MKGIMACWNSIDCKLWGKWKNECNLMQCENAWAWMNWNASTSNTFDFNMKITTKINVIKIWMIFLVCSNHFNDSNHLFNDSNVMHVVVDVKSTQNALEFTLKYWPNNIAKQFCLVNNVYSHVQFIRNWFGLVRFERWQVQN